MGDSHEGDAEVSVCVGGVEGVRGVIEVEMEVEVVVVLGGDSGEGGGGAWSEE